MPEPRRSLRKEALRWRQARKAFCSQVRRFLLPAFPVAFDYPRYKLVESWIQSFDTPTIHGDLSQSDHGKRRIAIVKADDLRCTNFNSFIELLRIMSTRNLPFTIGLICNEIPLFNKYQRLLLSSLDKRFVEIWHHGYDHKREIKWYRPFQSRWYEFQGTPETRQREHFHKGMDLARKFLDLEFSTFGPPSERMDQATESVLSDIDAINVVFNRKKCCKKLTLIVTHRIEEVVGKMGTYSQSLDKFALPLESDSPIVIQIHPGYWDKEDFEIFEKVLDHLARDLGFEFMTAHGYYEEVLNRAQN